MPSGVWKRRGRKMTDEEKKENENKKNAMKRQWRKDHPVEQHIIDKKYWDKSRKKIKQREYQKQWRKNKMENKKEKDNFLHVATEFLEKMKEKEDIDIDMINKWQGDITTLGIAIAKDFERAIEAKRKPKKISFITKIISKNEKDLEYFIKELHECIEGIDKNCTEAQVYMKQLREINGLKKK